MDGSPRRARLVVADGSGAVVGVTDARAVDVPWWPEAQSMLEAFADVLGGGAAIVRLVEAERSTEGWTVTYLAQRGAVGGAGPASPSTAVRSLDDTEIAALLGPTSELRMPWAELGGPAADVDWALVELAAAGATPSGRPRQHKTWNLSSVWELPLVDRSGVETAAWLKTVAPFGQHESAVLRLLAGHPVPHVLAADGHRQLLADLPGVDGFGATVAEQTAIVDSLVDIQLASADLVDDALAAGVPDRRSPALVDELRRSLSPLRVDVARLIDRVAPQLPAIEACGLPTVIVHGDAHPGNARIGVDRPVIFDWSDAFVGNPIWDLRRVVAGRDPTQRQVRDHWLGRWATAFPGSDPQRAAELSAPVAPLLAAAIYQGFVEGIEPSERIYHRADVWSELDAAVEWGLPGGSTGSKLPE